MDWLLKTKICGLLHIVNQDQKEDNYLKHLTYYRILLYELILVVMFELYTNLLALTIKIFTNIWEYSHL